MSAATAARLRTSFAAASLAASPPKAAGASGGGAHRGARAHRRQPRGDGGELLGAAEVKRAEGGQASRLALERRPKRHVEHAEALFKVRAACRGQPRIEGAKR